MNHDVINILLTKPISLNIVETNKLVLPFFKQGVYITYNSIFYKALIYDSTIVKSLSNWFQEATSTKQIPNLQCPI